MTSLSGCGTTPGQEVHGFQKRPGSIGQVARRGAVRRPANTGSRIAWSTGSNHGAVRVVYPASWLIAVLILTTVVQQFPPVLETYYEPFRIALYFGFATLFLFALLGPKAGRGMRVVDRFAWLCAYALGLGLVATLLGGSFDATLLSEVIVPFGVLYCSFRTPISPRGLGLLAGAYVALACLLALWVVQHYGQGFELSATYAVKSKNQVGPILGIGCITALWALLNSSAPDRLPRRLLIGSSITALLILFPTLLFVRNRAGIMGVLVISLLLLLQAVRRGTARPFTFGALFALLVSAALFTDSLALSGQYIWDSLTLNYNVEDADSLSAGRASVYVESLDFIAANPVFGGMGSDSGLAHVPHNYILNKLVAFGFLGAAPYVALYLSLWWGAIRGSLGHQDRQPSTLWRFVLAFVLLISLFEYTYPFGPGVSTVMVWLLIGQSLRHDGESRSDPSGARKSSV